jgi:hypothetical protein
MVDHQFTVSGRMNVKLYGIRAFDNRLLKRRQRAFRRVLVIATVRND